MSNATAAPPRATVTVAHIVYALHATAIVVGLVGSATIVGSFLASVPSVVAVVLNYATRRDAAGSWAASHFRWQIRTFWFALVWFVIGWICIFTIIGVVIGVPILVALTVWLLYRVARGWMRLANGQPMYS
jgi:uncharacterized membrane protein